MSVLSSHVLGEWVTPDAEGRPMSDAVTGEEIGRLATEGIDMAAVAGYGRRVGGPALRELSFHQRASLLKALAGYLREHREELYAVSARTGATTGDAKFDVDGGIGVLLAYASLGKRELPASGPWLDGDVVPLSKGGTFLAQHVYTPLQGVAVQVNAYNFPVWGPLEKLAPAFLAGVPSIIKPATPTAFLTAELARLIVASGLLPDGAVQFLAGSLTSSSGGDLFDHLTEQDLVSFTGSASTARRLRTHPVLSARAVRFTAEADSLNCSILGPDATPGTPEFDLYVGQLVTEMTVKAGQKCTAIRRAFVPAAQADAVVEAVREELAKVIVGDPVAEGVTMGALAGLEQREEVRRSLKSLMDGAEVVFGDPEQVEVTGADAQRGAFLSPVLLRGSPDSAAVHEVEAFGPVATVVPYASTGEVVELAARGQGSLAGSVVTADPEFAREVVLGTAPWHGRLLVLDRTDAKESTGHGSPMPQLVHGGPGRAGGGEEMGGLRGVAHHMQRSAVQGSPDMLSAITGRWVPGSARTVTDEHPFRKHLDDLRPGDTVVGGPRRVTEADVEHFAEFTGDTFYAHLDAEAAAANPFFGERVAHGYLVVSFAAGLFVDPAPGPVLANFGVDNLRFLTPVRFDDELTITLTAKQISPRASAAYGEVRWDAEVVNGDGAPVAKYDVLTLVAKRDA
ncbi:phenylacetic acid degradation bifunctional protein PaaZ [Actinomycetospora lutea]|uniref:phenylacetic acid degradation bifunctional protein PaaZ n=1 Tax=Actinomycetospora lutea TaxID=663604 RepID=UPI0023659918|nr:phenylacetic acid degradation bifunctional protein PaaZ [Actinomycetospora lutea]MDD7940282.1 phenylacetic acid degradation bifunctional protein PaaZ [Actinomycetospora lutea]